MFFGMKKEKKDYVLKVFCVIFIFIYSNIPTLFSYFPISSDENGYIGQAAFMSGLNWNGVVSQLSYFSFGNGPVAAIIFKTIHNPTIAYRLLLMFNSVLLIASYFIIIRIIQMKYTDITNQEAIFISFVIISYSANYAHTDLFLAESYITFFVWVLILCLIYYIKTDKNVFLYSFLAVSIWLFFIHQRMLGMLVASVVIVLVNKLYLKRFFDCTKLLMFGGIVFFPFLVWKKYCKSVLWASNEQGTMLNDFSVYVKGSFFENLFTREAINGIFYVLSGRIWYMVLASLGITLFAFIIIIKKIRADGVKSVCDGNLLEAYLMLSFLVCFGITILNSYIPQRVDSIPFGRYMDSIVGPLLMIGICNIYAKENYKLWNRTFKCSISIVALLGCFIEKYACNIAERADWFSPYSNVAIFVFFEEKYHIGTFLVTSLVYCIIMIFLSFYIKIKKSSILVAMFIIHTINSFGYHIQTIKDCNQEYCYDLMEVADYISEHESIDEINYLSYNINANELQYLTPNIKCTPIYIENDEWESQTRSNYIFLLKYQFESFFDNDKYDVCFQNDYFYLVIESE